MPHHDRQRCSRHHRDAAKNKTDFTRVLRQITGKLFGTACACFCRNRPAGKIHHQLARRRCRGYRRSVLCRSSSLSGNGNNPADRRGARAPGAAGNDHQGTMCGYHRNFVHQVDVLRIKIVWDNVQRLKIFLDSFLAKAPGKSKPENSCFEIVALIGKKSK